MALKVFHCKGFEVPFKAKICKDFYYMYQNDRSFGKIGFELLSNFCNYRAEYILSVSNVSYLADDYRPNEIFSYVIHRNDSSLGTVLYYAYTIKHLRCKGFVKEILKNIGVDKLDYQWVSFIGTRSLEMDKKRFNFVKNGV